MIQPRTGERMGDTREGDGLSDHSGSEVSGKISDLSKNESENLNVFELNPRKVYSILEVDRILPIVRRITQEYVEKVQILMARFESAKGRHDHKLPLIEREINEA